MDIDDLKKSWNAIDKKLDEKEVISEHRLSDLMQVYKRNTNKNLKKLKVTQQVSIGVGFISIVACIVLWFILPRFISNPVHLHKVMVGIISFGGIMIFGIWWDSKTYRVLKQIQVDEMPVIQVQKKMSEFRTLTKYELWIVGALLLILIGLAYWIMDLYSLPLTGQIIFLSFEFLLCGVILYLFYKTLVYNPLNEAQKNLKEINELETGEYS